MEAIASTKSSNGRTLAIANPEVLKRILAKMIPLLDHGMPVEMARKAAGVSESTYFRWKRLGKEVNSRCDGLGLMEPDDSFSDEDRALWKFWQAVENAMLQALDRSLLTIQVASQNHWQAAAWLCERRYPEQFGRTYKVQHSGDQENPVAVKDVTPQISAEEVLRKLSPAERATMLEAQRIMQRATQGGVTADRESSEVSSSAR